MKSPLFVLVIVILGSLSFPMEQESSLTWEYPIQSGLECERAFNRLYPWIEEQYAYSHRQYYWEGENRIVAVRRGISAYEDSRGRRVRYGYSMDIRIEEGQVLVSFKDVQPLDPRGFSKRNWNSLEQEALRQDLVSIGQALASLFQG